MTSNLKLWQALLLLLALCCFGCEPPAPGPRSDSQTNWLRTCESARDCGELSCLCGVCTEPCTTDAECSRTPGASCLPAEHSGAIAVCGGQQPSVGGLCLPGCDDERACGSNATCVAGACQPLGAPNARVAIDTATRFQQLTGFGATVGYAEDELMAFPDRAALDEVLFARLGLDVLRFRNRYGEVSDAGLAQATNIVSAAAQSLGRKPLLLLTSWSPPAALKQNGATFCASDPLACTLVKVPGGDFDYAGLAQHWRRSLDAYAGAGFVPDYIGIQNNPDWVPSGGAVNEACRFLPSQGTIDVTVNGVQVPVEYPGYREGLQAVLGALADLPTRPRILAPELGHMRDTDLYLNELDASQVDAIAHHMYGADPSALDVAALRGLAELQDGMGIPLFQTEMQAGGFDTAVLMHHALVDGSAAMYLQTALVGPLSGPVTNPSALVGMDGDGFVLQDAYFAMSHYSRFTDPAWVRVAANTSTEGLLTSAWLAPERDALSVVFINTTATPLVVELDLGSQPLRAARLIRSSFAGAERSSELGAWTLGSNIALPPHAVATLVVEE
jgi:O-glycosyl hydrolase